MAAKNIVTLSPVKGVVSLKSPENISFEGQTYKPIPVRGLAPDHYKLCRIK